MDERFNGRARLSTNEMHPTRDRPSSQPTRKASPKVSGGAQGGGSTWGARLASVRAVLGVHKGAREPSGASPDIKATRAPQELPPPCAPPRVPPRFPSPGARLVSRS